MLFSKKKDSAEATEKDTAAMSATDFLKKDHRTVSALFKQLDGTDEAAQKVTLAQQICIELTVHAEAEERVLYPAARKALNENSEDLVDEAAVEHRSLKMLMAEIDGSSPDDALFDANLTVLKEYVDHHVKEEEHEMFPKLIRSDGFDNEAVGAQLAETKAQLTAKVEAAMPPRAGAKPAVHVPDLSGKGKSSKTTSSSAQKSSSSSKGGSPAAKPKNGRASATTRAPHQ